MEIRAAEFTTSNVGDAPMLPELLDQIPREQEIETVTAHGAFDPRKFHDAIAGQDAVAFGHALEPVAGMPSLPPRKNAKPWKPDTASAIARNEILHTSKRVGRTIRRRWCGNHAEAVQRPRCTA